MVEREKEEEKENRTKWKRDPSHSPRSSTFDPLIRFLQPFLECREITYLNRDDGAYLVESRVFLPRLQHYS